MDIAAWFTVFMVAFLMDNLKLRSNLKKPNAGIQAFTLYMNNPVQNKVDYGWRKILKTVKYLTACNRLLICVN